MPELDPKDQKTFEAMVKTTQKFFPKYKVRPKESMWVHRAIGWILKTFTPNKRYMEDFWTFFNNTNCWPKENYPGDHYKSWDIHIHEGTHAGQEKKWTSLIWGSLYLLGTPVYAVVFLLLSIPFFVVGGLVSAFPWWSGFIVLGLGLVLSSPVPFAAWRAEWELQGYGASVAVEYWTTGDVTDRYLDRLVRTFSGGEYFYMCVFKKKVRRRLEKARDLVRDKQFLTKWEPRYADFYAACYQTLKDQGRVKV